VFPWTYLPRFFNPLLRARELHPSWKPVAIVSWCGMRGIVSLAAALALPLALPDGSAFPYRSLVIYLAFAVILFTLVIQGLTLAPLIRLLRQGTDWSPVEEEQLAREGMTRAGLIEVNRFSREEGVPDHVRDPVRSEYEIRLKCVEPRQLAFTFADNLGLRLRRAVVRAERRELIRLWREEAIGAEVLQSLQRELDFEEARLN
jgi:CPA1 family monovalent cation:H+ antiporter